MSVFKLDQIWILIPLFPLKRIFFMVTNRKQALRKSAIMIQVFILFSKIEKLITLKITLTIILKVDIVGSMAY